MVSSAQAPSFASADEDRLRRYADDTLPYCERCTRDVLAVTATARADSRPGPAGQDLSPFPLDRPPLDHPEDRPEGPQPAEAAGSAVTAQKSKDIPTLFSDYKALFKVRVTSMVIVAAWAGFYLGSVQSGISTLQVGLLQALIGIGLVSAGASALNEVIERKSDAKMVRTARRPLATGRIGLLHGLLLGFAALIAGSVALVLWTNMATLLLALLTVFTYVAIYTPLKRKTTLATFIGAFPGAMGPLLGWTAARGRIEWPAIALFAILFVWQFPHFMAIAWLYREDYARAGIRMLPVVQPDGWSTVAEALVCAVLMIPVSLLPWYLGISGRIYAGSAIVLGIGYLAYTIRFRRIIGAKSNQESRGCARDLLKFSVTYLPLLLVIMMLDAAGGRR